MPKRRTQVFLESHQHERVCRIAEAEGSSISAVVRRFVDQGLEQRTMEPEEWLELLRRAGEFRRLLEERHGVYGGDPVAEARAEWERERGSCGSDRLSVLGAGGARDTGP